MRNWMPPRPNVAQDVVLFAMFLATAFALLWLASQRPRPEPADTTIAVADTPAPVVTVAPRGEPFIDNEFHGPPDPTPDELDPAETPNEGSMAANTPTDTTPTPAPTETRDSPSESVWTVIEADRYPIDADTVSLYARLPGPYEWPLPRIDRLTLICFRKEGEPRHVGIMQTADGRLYHWGEERRYLQEHLDATRIDSTEIRTVADPRAFMQPLRAAVHGACQRSMDETEAPEASG